MNENQTPEFIVKFQITSRLTFESLDEVVAVGKAIEYSRKRFLREGTVIEKEKRYLFAIPRKEPAFKDTFLLASPSEYLADHLPEKEMVLSIDASIPENARWLGDLEKLSNHPYKHRNEWRVEAVLAESPNSRFEIKAIWAQSANFFSDLTLKAITS